MKETMEAADTEEIHLSLPALSHTFYTQKTRKMLQICLWSWNCDNGKAGVASKA